MSLRSPESYGAVRTRSTVRRATNRHVPRAWIGPRHEPSLHRLGGRVSQVFASLSPLHQLLPRMMKITNVLLSFAVLGAAACHPGPVLSPKLAANGTIAGIVSNTAKAAVADHKVTAIDVATGARFEATTGANGGYTIKVPEGTY